MVGDRLHPLHLGAEGDGKMARSDQCKAELLAKLLLGDTKWRHCTRLNIKRRKVFHYVRIYSHFERRDLTINNHGLSDIISDNS